MNSMINSASSTDSAFADSDLVSKVRWSIRQRLRFQMQHLSADFFDKVDDFLFAGGQQGQFAGDSGYLKSMREIRAKQGLFEETFLRAVMTVIEESEIDSAGLTAVRGQSSEREVIYESLEIDLALQAMYRKAERHYLPYLKQIVAIDQKLKEEGQGGVIPHDILIKATLTAFTDAQNLMSLDLDVRLIFLKLFEKNFLLKMEKFFVEIIRILKNINNDEFVEKLVSSSSAIEKKNTDSQRAARSLTEHVLGRPDDSEKSARVEAEVAAFIDATCQRAELPRFLEKMIRDTWRSVMFMIGFNRGSDSIEWNEAIHTMTVLTTAVGDGLALSATERLSLAQQIQNGFKLIQVEKGQQQHFFTELEKLFESLGRATTDGLSKGRVVTGSVTPESSVSKAGEQILDRDDLNEIAKMLGGDDEEEELDAGNMEKQFEDYLMEIDMLTDDARVEFQMNGEYKTCVLQKNTSNPDLYNICNAATKVTVPRSRLGLAISLKSGELRLLDQRMASVMVRQKTLLEAPTPKSIN